MGLINLAGAKKPLGLYECSGAPRRKGKQERGYPTLRGLKQFSPKEWPNLKATFAVPSASHIRATLLGWAKCEIYGKPEHVGLWCMVVWGCLV